MNVAYVVITAIAAVLAIVQAVGWLSVHDVWVGLKNRFSKKRTITDREVQRQLWKLKGEVSDSGFRPTKIVAIGGGDLVGGYIVGAYLSLPRLLGASLLQLEYTRPENIPRPECVRYVVSQLDHNNDRIIVVDDVSKGGDTIKKAFDAIKKAFKDQFGHEIAESALGVFVVCRYSRKLLKDLEKQLKPDFKPALGEDFWHVPNRFCGFLADKEVEFPWKA